MNADKKNKVLKVLKYWRGTELLKQESIPYIEKIKDEDLNKSTIELCYRCSAYDLPEFRTVSQKHENEHREKFGYQYAKFKPEGEVYYLFGSIKRNIVIEYLLEKSSEELPEIYYSEKERIAWFSLKRDTNDQYIANSFKLSPILWYLVKGEKYLDTEAYDYENCCIDHEIEDFEETGRDYVTAIYDYVNKNYVKKCGFKKDLENDVLLIYRRTSKENSKINDLKDYSSLSSVFYEKDISYLIKMIERGEFGDKNAYQEKVVDYILSSVSLNSNKGRISISPKEPRDKIQKFFSEILSPTNSPMGKWPSVFSPALMQQTAINIAISRDDKAPIFSVNGPPGTGKTTLLKEIIAHNMVERAHVLCEYANPDDLFVEHNFACGRGKNGSYSKFAQHYYSIKNDKINDYSMLVVSSNNTAVENITKDLPVYDSLISEKDSEKNDKIREVYNLFDIEKSNDVFEINNAEQKDVYFTYLAEELLTQSNNKKSDDETEDSKVNCWGLISAALGKESNINKYCYEVIGNFLYYYATTKNRNKYIEKYKETRKIYNKQYQKVLEIRKNLTELYELRTKYGDYTVEEIKTINEQCEYNLPSYQAYITELNNRLSLKGKELENKNEEVNKINGKLFSRLSNKKKIKNKQSEIEYVKKEIDDLNKNVQEYQSQINVCTEIIKFGRLIEENPDVKYIDSDFMNNYVSGENGKPVKSQLTNPLITEDYNREREKLFYYACKLHRDFVLSSTCMRANLINLRVAWGKDSACQDDMDIEDKIACLPYLMQSLFLLTPVISSTFASVGTMFRDVKKCGFIGNLIVDEAGQAQPQMAVGALFRARKAIVVGDPKQIEPVVTPEEDIINRTMVQRGPSAFLRNYSNKNLSVQGFADAINPYGTYLGEGDAREWVGCPLIVHRRCLDPMFSISNALSYDNTMINQAVPKKEKEENFIYDKSVWIDVEGEEKGDKNHYVKEQGEVVLKLLKSKFEKDDKPSLFIISPFITVKEEIKKAIKNSDLGSNENVEKWMSSNIGTVHTFQGKEADEVIFLLGCDEKAAGAVRFVNSNILNVAATRAKYRFYIVGSKNVWNSGPLKVAQDKMFGNIISADEAEKLLYRCPRCGSKIIIKINRRTKELFWGCSSYPNCRYSKSLN